MTSVAQSHLPVMCEATPLSILSGEQHGLICVHQSTACRRQIACSVLYGGNRTRCAANPEKCIVETRDIVFIALFAAIVAVLGIFPPLMIPLTGVPISAQSLGPMLAGGVLGARRGALAMALFILVVALGLPLLSGGRGGLSVFVSPTGGYLLGYASGAAVTGWMVERFWSRLTFWRAFAAAVTGGIGAVYLPGVPWSAAASHLPLSTAALATLPFLPGDLTKSAIAAAVMLSVKRSYPLITPRAR